MWWILLPLVLPGPVSCGEAWRAPVLPVDGAHVYRFEATVGQRVTFETRRDTSAARPVNTRVRLRRAGRGEVLAENNDKAWGDLYSRLEACVTDSGTYELWIDAWPGTIPGSYAAHLSCALADRRSDTCDTAFVQGCGALRFDHDSRCLQNDFEAGPLGCTGSATSGGDAVLALQVPAGAHLEAQLQSTADAALYLVRACEDAASTCVAGADRHLAGGTESLRYDFHDAGTWYLVLDHHGGGQGTLALRGMLHCPTTVQSMTWSQVRRHYRE